LDVTDLSFCTYRYIITCVLFLLYNMYFLNNKLLMNRFIYSQAYMMKCRFINYLGFFIRYLVIFLT